LNDFSAHHLRLVLADAVSNNASQQQTVPSDNGQGINSDGDTTLVIRLFQENSGSVPWAELQRYSPTLDVFYAPNQIPPASSPSSPLASFIANELQTIFTEEQATLAYLLSSHGQSHNSKMKSLSPEMIANLDRQSTRAFKYAPTYHLTFSLFTPTATPSAWDIENALKQYIHPLLEALSELSNFTVDTQVQLYAAFSPSIRQPEYDENLRSWTLRKDDLSGFINAAEWPLSPSIGEGPTVNFVLYVPSGLQSPLVVKETGVNSWLIPQWGGIYIANLDGLAQTSSISGDVLRPAMLTFSKQLLSLVGLPETPDSLPLRLATLTRVRAASLLFSASSTLGALARLTQALPSIAIPDTVADAVESTITHLDSTCNALRDGRFQAALEHARVAETEAEKAFFERSMVGMVYFPDEHKVAVYLPLLGPVAVPLIMAALKEIKKLTQTRPRAQTS
jgi:GPI-anchor transamidase subunit S